MAQHAGYLIDWYRISPEDQNRAMTRAFHDDIEPLRDALGGAVLPIFRGGSLDESASPGEPTGPGRAPDFWHLAKSGTQVLTEARTHTAQSTKHARALAGLSGVNSPPTTGRSATAHRGATPARAQRVIVTALDPI